MATNDNGSRPFPEDLYGNILLRLPVKSLLRFKCVCKNWFSLIKNPNFIREHLNNCSKNKSPQLLIYDYGASHGSPPITLISDLDVVPIHENPDYFQRLRGMNLLIGSVDGLFLLKSETDEKNMLALWNPAIREVRPLPELKILYSTPTNFLGFGLDPSTNDYKVVYLEFCFNGCAGVYSCSRDSWRIFTTKIYEYFKVNREAYGTTYLNGAYYWLLSAGDKCIVLSFDFKNEVFEEIDGPPDCSSDTRLILLDDSVSLLNFYGYDFCSIWVMIQPGVWNKFFTFQCFQYIMSWYSSTVIFVTRSSRLVSYNVRTQKITHLGFRHPGLKFGCEVYPYSESLVTIKREHEDLDHCNYPDIFNVFIDL